MMLRKFIAELFWKEPTPEIPTAQITVLIDQFNRKTKKWVSSPPIHVFAGDKLELNLLKLKPSYVKVTFEATRG